MPAVLSALTALLAASPASAQTPSAVATVEPQAAPESAVEAYLAERGLRELLAAYLEQRLAETTGPARAVIADRLGKEYVELLDKAPTADARREWEKRSEELLRAVPESESFDLRINLTKVRYLHAEQAAERHRLRMTAPDELQEAQQTLRSVAATFEEIGAKAHRKVEILEKREQQGNEEDTEALKALLADARRARSLAMYYAGWSNYYQSYLLERPVNVEEAVTQWGYLLNAVPGRPASIERLPASLLRYEHVARAAVGCALAESLRNNHENALRWLDAVETAEGVSKPVLDQLFARRIVVLAAAKRWADLELIVRRRRLGKPGDPARPLAAGEARLIAVATFEALRDQNVAKYARDQVQALGEAAVADLVSLGEVKHVLELVTTYGSAPLGGEGFIVNYVRGLQSYEKARAAHAAAAPGKEEEPSTDDAVANQYREAASALEAAVASGDGTKFPDERANAGLLIGLSCFYAGEYERAADRLEDTSKSAAGNRRAEEALWLAVVALDRAVEGGRKSLADRRDRLATLYIQTFPGNERAARLLLRQATGGQITEEQAAQVLLAVSAESPLYEAARRQAARLLYSIYRRASGSDRDFAAARFADVAEELLARERRVVQEGDEAATKEAAERAILRVRQILDAVLGMSAPDLSRAERALEVLDAVRAQAGLDLSSIDGEITYRRLQIALARSQAETADKWLARLHEIGGVYSDTADRLLYRRAVADRAVARDDPEAALRVIRYGQRVINQFGSDAKAFADPAVGGVYDAVAEAAAQLWRLRADPPMRDLAIRLDRTAIAGGLTTRVVLRRFAELTEASGDAAAALDAWRTLLAGLDSGSEPWYEARYQSLRLLMGVEPARAREVMDQYKVLHPDYGPPPWGPKLKDLDAAMSLDRRPAPAAPPSGDTAEPAEGAG